jgi:hypothetical protein
VIERGWPSRGCWLALAATGLLALDIAWESTALSWERGPQMVGFTLIHTAGILVVPAILASVGWIVVSLVGPVFTTRKWRLSNIVGAVCIVALLRIASLSYGFWVGAFADRIARGPHASEFLVYMVALGELSAVRALLDQGVPVDAPNREGRTAMQVARNTKQREILDYLASRGAK